MFFKNAVDSEIFLTLIKATGPRTVRGLPVWLLGEATRQGLLGTPGSLGCIQPPGGRRDGVGIAWGQGEPFHQEDGGRVKQR